MMDDTDWTMISFEKPKKVVVAEKSPATTVWAGDAGYTEGTWLKTCSKCGRVLGKGGHFHVKHCKGVE